MNEIILERAGRDGLIHRHSFAVLSLLVPTRLNEAGSLFWIYDNTRDL